MNESARAQIPPLLPWAVGLMCGILIDSRYAVPPEWSLLLLAGVTLTLLVRHVRERLAIPVALLLACCIGALLHHHDFREVPADDIVTFTSPEPRIARLRGTIVSRPRIYRPGEGPFAPWMFDPERTSFLLAAEHIETTSGWSETEGLVRVTVKEPALAAQEGAGVEAFGMLYRPLPPQNPGAFDWRTFNARRGIRAGLSCQHAENVHVIRRSVSQPVWSLGRMRQQVRRMLLGERIETGDDEVSLLDAMVLGRRAGMDRDIEQSFVNTGCAHYLAVSGLHVGMLAAVIWAPCRLFGASRRRSALIVAAAVCAYALLADPRPPILRATVMICAYCATLLFRRRRSTMSAMSLAAIVLLVADPASLFDVGFQLSFITVTGIVLGSPLVMSLFDAALARRFTPIGEVSGGPSRLPALLRDRQHTLRYRIGRGLFAAVGVAIIAWLCALPITGVCFGRVSPWGCLNSLIALPFVFVVMVLGFAKLVVSVAMPVLAAPIDSALGGASWLLLWVMDLLERLPGSSVSVPSPSWWACVAYYGLASVVILRRREMVSRRFAGALAAICVSLCLCWWCVPRSPDGVRVTQFAVGRGTSTVIELPGGHVWIYDAGTSGSFDPGRSAVVPYLRYRDIRQIDGIIISHPNLDHFGGVPAILDAVQCGRVMVPPQFERLATDNSPAEELLGELRRRGFEPVTIDTGTQLNLSSDVNAQILWPAPSVPASLEANDISIVLRIGHGGRSVLFTGDIGSAAQQGLIESGDISADVLILPHHGAVEVNTKAFLEAVGATYVVRSSFVRDEESKNLADAIGKARLFNTAEVGAVELLLRNGEVSVHGFRDR